MTDEQIKQNAEEYASTKEMHSPRSQDVELDKLMIIEDYIAGAHSRDEEIYDLKRDIEDLQKMVKMRSDAFACARNEIERLSNPWISVEDRLPEKWKRIKVHSGTGEACWAWVSKTVFVIAEGWYDDPEKAFYDFDSKIWWSEYGDNIENLFGAPEHWMPIPKLQKGE